MTIYASQVPSPRNEAHLVVCTYCQGTQVDPLCSAKREESLTALAPCPACAGEGMRAHPATLPAVNSDVY